MEYSALFTKSFDRLIGNEGGYVFNPKDPGGETKWGISKRSYPLLDIKSLTRAQSKAIFNRDFWVRGQMERYDPAISFQVFDFAVNSSIETAVRYMQRAAGVADDGFIGPITLAAVKAMAVPRLIMLFAAERLVYWTKLTTWDEFGKGWAVRAANDLRYGAADIT